MHIRTESKAYCLWYPENKKIIISRDVKFIETGMIKTEKKEENEEIKIFI